MPEESNKIQNDHVITEYNAQKKVRKLKKLQQYNKSRPKSDSDPKKKKRQYDR